MGHDGSKVVGIVQARTGSTRLPGKVLMEVLGKPVILRMLERVSRATTLQELWLATSDQPSDDLLAKTVAEAGFNVFRGSENDVLGRFHELAVRIRAGLVVRLTGDCPLHDPSVIDELIVRFTMTGLSYGSNVLPPSYPDGLDAEVFTMDALQKAHEQCNLPSEREHVTLGIHRRYQGSLEQPEIFNLRAPADFSHMRWTLDYPEDFEFIRTVYDELYETDPLFGWLDVVALTTRRPELLAVNQAAQRNEAITKAMQEGELV